MQREEKMRKFNIFGFMNMNPSHDVKTMEAHKCTLTATHIHIRATFESVICTNSLAELYCNLSQVLKS